MSSLVNCSFGLYYIKSQKTKIDMEKAVKFEILKTGK